METQPGGKDGMGVTPSKFSTRSVMKASDIWPREEAAAISNGETQKQKNNKKPTT
jgi:hypothetical protein